MNLWIIFGIVLIAIGSFAIYYGVSIENKIDKNEIKKEIIDSRTENNKHIEKLLNEFRKDLKVNIDKSEKSLDGFSLHTIIEFHNKNLQRRQYIFDFGDLNHDRYSGYLDKNDNICFRIIDSQSESYTIKLSKDKINKLFEKFYYLNFELGLSENYSVLKIYINGREQVRQTFDYRVEIKSFDKVKGKIGANISGSENGAFTMAYMLIYKKTLSYKEKLQKIRFFKREVNLVQELKDYN